MFTTKDALNAGYFITLFPFLVPDSNPKDGMVELTPVSYWYDCMHHNPLSLYCIWS